MKVRATAVRLAFAAMVCLAGTALGGDIDRKDLLIIGLSLEVDATTVVADAGIAAAVQTKFGGKTNEDAPPDNGMTAVGELSGPGIDTPIHLTTRPGHLFQLPVLYEKGDYILRNIRLVSADGKVLQTAVPSFANITITQVLDTKLSIRQLTPDDLRARGITVDASNFDVFDQFFAVILNVGNSAPAASAITIDSITATLDAPLGLRLAKTTPAVTIGQAVPVFDEKSGAHYLVVAAQGARNGRSRR